MGYENPRAKDKKDEETEHKAHIDSPQNIAFFNRIIEKVVILNPAFNWEIQDCAIEDIYNPKTEKYETVRRIKDYKAVLFYWPACGEKMFTNLSFHEKNGEFRDLLAWFLNRMGQIGMITKKGRAEEKKYKESKDQWDSLYEGLRRG